MDETQIRLLRCFLALFPELNAEEIVRATPTSIKRWDSLASVTLLTLVEEEFAVEIDVDDLDQFTSFERILALLQRRNGDGDTTRS